MFIGNERIYYYKALAAEYEMKNPSSKVIESHTNDTFVQKEKLGLFLRARLDQLLKGCIGNRRN